MTHRGRTSGLSSYQLLAELGNEGDLSILPGGRAVDHIRKTYAGLGWLAAGVFPAENSPHVRAVMVTGGEVVAQEIRISKGKPEVKTLKALVGEDMSFTVVSEEPPPPKQTAAGPNIRLHQHFISLVLADGKNNPLYNAEANAAFRQIVGSAIQDPAIDPMLVAFHEQLPTPGQTPPS